MKCTGVEVFSATMGRQRDQMSERITEWLRANPAIDIADIRTLQSSDNEFHCVTVIVLYNGTAKVAPRRDDVHDRGGLNSGRRGA